MRVFKWLRALLFYPAGSPPPRIEFFEGNGPRLIFDHLGNMVVATLVAQAGLVALSLQAVSWARIPATAIGVGLVVIGFCLFGLNLIHGEYLLRQSPDFAMLRRGRGFLLLEKAYWIVYISVAIPACFFNLARAL